MELLRQDVVGSAASKVMAELAFQEDLPPFAWIRVLIHHRAEASAALRVFSKHIRPEDNAPELLRSLATDVSAGSAEAITAPPYLPLLWTRQEARHHPIIIREN